MLGVRPMPRAEDLPLDTTLLRAFDALLRERNVTRAARRLGVTQPALSRSLARLRRAFGDPLFVRTPTEMVATPRARALEGRVRRLLDDLRGLTREEAPFVPAEAQRRFSLCTSDYAQCVIVPPLVAALARNAPGLALDAPRLAASGVERRLPGPHGVSGASLRRSSQEPSPSSPRRNTSRTLWLKGTPAMRGMRWANSGSTRAEPGKKTAPNCVTQ